MDNQTSFIRGRLSTLSASIALSLLALSSPVSADEIENIVIIGRMHSDVLNLPANVSVVDATDIADSGVTKLTEALRNLNGIQISDNGTGAVLAMRGFSSEQAANNTLILVDGRRLNNIDIAAPNLNSIPLNMIERIEILNGSAGVLYGDQAVGGVINIITRAPDKRGGHFSLSGGSFATREAKGDIAGSFAENWHYYLSGNQKKSDNYRQHNDIDTGAVLGRVGYRDQLTDFYLESSYFDNNVQIPGALTKQQFLQDPRQSDEHTSYQHDITTAWRSGLSRKISDNWKLSADANYSDSNVTSNWGRNDRSQLMLSPKAVASIPTPEGELTLVSGVDISKGKSRFSSGRNNTQTSLSPYVQASVPLTPKLSYVVGGRYADVHDDLYDHGVYPAGITLKQHAKAFELGLNYHLSDANRLYLRGEDNFRFAKVDEQAYTPPGVVGLKPQTGRSWEAGWDYSNGGLQSRFNLYRLNLENEIIFDPDPALTPNNGNYPGANVNAEASRRYGANLSLDWQPLVGVMLGGEYHYIDASFTAGAHKGKSLSWVAKHSGRVYTSWDITEQWQIYSDLAYTGRRYEEGDNANVLPQLGGYTLVNLALNYRHGHWLASLRADNLLDKQYVSTAYYSSYNPGSGRGVFLTAAYNF